MTANKKIILNVLATYGRSLYAIIFGLLTGRWVLLSLGNVDYGLLGVVGGLSSIITFLNGLLATSVGRYLAYSVGCEMADSESGCDDCVKWFNTALFVHIVVAVVLTVVGYPIGIWAIHNFLTIPPDRLNACVWVWRFVMISCFVSMINVPFGAVYTARQEIAELTIYSFVTTTATGIFSYYMITHPGDWFVAYSCWTMLLVVVTQFLICIRGIAKFNECRIIPRYMVSIARIQELVKFAGARFLGFASYIVSTQGSVILVNKMLGPTRNATMTIGNTVAEKCQTLATSLTSAFTPAITNLAGAHDYPKMRKYIYNTCIFSATGVLVFAIPISVEIKEIMRIWLTRPPLGCDSVCLAMLLSAVLEMSSCGLAIGILAMGRIFRFSLLLAIVFMSVLPVAYFLVKIGLDVTGVAMAMTIAQLLALLVKLYYARKLCGISARYWTLRIFLPLLCCSICAVLAGNVPKSCLEAGLCRVLCSVICAELVLLPLAWRFLLNAQMKDIIRSKANVIIARLKGCV